MTYFIECEDALLLKDEIMDFLWPDEADGRGGDERLVQIIARLRKKLRQHSDHGYIRTVHGRGYQFIQPR